MPAGTALLNDGACILAQSRQAINRAARLQEQTRELILTYRRHRLRVIAGSSDLNDPDRRTILRVLASQPTKTFAGLSRGGVCMLCGAAINREQIEYEIVSASLAMTVDVDCHKQFMNEIPEPPSPRNNGVRAQR